LHSLNCPEGRTGDQQCTAVRTPTCWRTDQFDADGMKQLSVSSDVPLSESSDGEAEAHEPNQTSVRAAVQHVERSGGCRFPVSVSNKKLWKVEGQRRTPSCTHRSVTVLIHVGFL
ncbi:hypothetical protein XENORESO_011842, partial [Xenotaenia resolanae]